MGNRTGAIRQCQVLLVEDEPGTQTALAVLLELEGFDVTCADDGQHALECLTHMRPAVIVTDYMMPRMDGLEMLRRIQADGKLPAIPVLLMSSGLPANVDPLACADRFLRKPLNLEALFATIADLVE